MSQENNEVSNMRAIRAEDLVEELRRERSRVFALRGAQILGKFDLRDHTIEIAVDFQRCQFSGEVDLRYCEFMQVVNFSECTFRADFHSEARTVYRKDLICDRARFEGVANFADCQIEGSAYFSGTNFKNETEPIILNSTVIGKDLWFEEALFAGPAYFHSFECGGNGFFNRAEFRDSTDFRRASFGGSLECIDAVYQGSTEFGSLKCSDSGFFSRAEFKSEEVVTFANASFGGGLYCNDAVFEGPTSFESLECGDLVCDEAAFNREANFNTLKCGGNAFFREASFQGPGMVDFAYSSFGRNLECTGAGFAGHVTFAYARISQTLVLTGTRFQQRVSLFSTTITSLALSHEDYSTVFEKGSLDLRECAFERFSGPREAADDFVAAQDPALFTMDPYTRLEKYYERIGVETEARRMRYLGRRAMRKNALAVNGRIKWTLQRRIADWFLQVLTGYGVQSWRLVYILVFYIVMGMLVFWPDYALKPVSPNSTLSSTNQTSAAPALSREVPKPTSIMEKFWHRAGYSVDLLMPSSIPGFFGVQGLSLFDLGYTRAWQPNGHW